MLDRQTVNEQWPESATAPTQDGDVGEGSVPDESKVIVQTTRLGRFMLLKEIGSGGMGTVFAAYDEQLDRKVALKILRKPRVGSARQRLQILREARAAARISHPNVVSIYEVNEADGLIHIAMEYVEGETLLKWQAKGGHQWRDILGLYLQVGMALQAAHDADVVHRDIKPWNFPLLNLPKFLRGEFRGKAAQLIPNFFGSVNKKSSTELLGVGSKSVTSIAILRSLSII